MAKPAEATMGLFLYDHYFSLYIVKDIFTWFNLQEISYNVGDRYLRFVFIG